MHAYLDNLHAICAGNLYWSRSTSRYLGHGNPSLSRHIAGLGRLRADLGTPADFRAWAMKIADLA